MIHSLRPIKDLMNKLCLLLCNRSNAKYANHQYHGLAYTPWSPPRPAYALPGRLIR